VTEKTEGVGEAEAEERVDQEVTEEESDRVRREKSDGGPEDTSDSSSLLARGSGT
jgi:hypothetical protein